VLLVGHELDHQLHLVVGDRPHVGRPHVKARERQQAIVPADELEALAGGLARARSGWSNGADRAVELGASREADELDPIAADCGGGHRVWFFRSLSDRE
jgi:hypothetical protein